MDVNAQENQPEINFKESLSQFKSSTPQGLKKSFHGNIYQVKLSLLYGFHLREIPDEIFCIGQEYAGGAKFDDLVIFTKNRNDTEKKNVIFLQAKHSQIDGRKITLNCLEKGRIATDNPFSLIKYYDSYKEIKKQFKSEEFENCFICTNFCFNEAVERRMTKIEIGFPFFQKNGGSVYQVKLDGDIYEFQEVLKKSNDFLNLVETLIKHIKNSTELQHWNAIYKIYHVALIKEKILDFFDYTDKKIGKKMVLYPVYKFHDDFINDRLEGDAKHFRTAIVSELSKPKYKTLSSIADIKCTADRKFGIPFVKESNVSDCKTFAKQLYKLIKESGDDITNIEDTGGIIEPDLAGHVFVYAENKNTIKFTTSFFSDSFVADLADNDTKRNLLNFKNAIKNEITWNNPDYDNTEETLENLFNGLQDCIFIVKSYITCYEYSTTLPTADGDINTIIGEQNEFLGKLRFAVNQPNETKLSDDITAQLTEICRISDSKLVADFMLVKFIDWTKNSETTLYDRSDIDGFIEEGKQKLAKIALTAPTIQYCNKLHSLNSTPTIISAFEIFLQNNELQLLWMRCTNNPSNIASNVKNTLIKYNEYYQCDDSFIFSPLSFFAYFSEKTLLTFEYPVNDPRLLIIVDDGCNNIKEAETFGKKLLDIITNHKQKKLIIISKNDSEFAGIFDGYERKKEEEC